MSMANKPQATVAFTYHHTKQNSSQLIITKHLKMLEPVVKLSLRTQSTPHKCNNWEKTMATR